MDLSLDLVEFVKNLVTKSFNLFTSAFSFAILSSNEKRDWSSFFGASPFPRVTIFSDNIVTRFGRIWSLFTIGNHRGHSVIPNEFQDGLLDVFADSLIGLKNVTWITRIE